MEHETCWGVNGTNLLGVVAKTNLRELDVWGAIPFGLRFSGLVPRQHSGKTFDFPTTSGIAHSAKEFLLLMLLRGAPTHPQQNNIW